jgi:hypothetical protein
LLLLVLLLLLLVWLEGLCTARAATAAAALVLRQLRVGLAQLRLQHGHLARERVHLLAQDDQVLVGGGGVAAAAARAACAGARWRLAGQLLLQSAHLSLKHSH